LGIEIVAGEELRRFAAFFQPLRTQTQSDDCRRKRCVLEFGAQNVEHRTLLCGRKGKRYVETARVRIF
jgi:hypothetical protein